MKTKLAIPVIIMLCLVWSCSGPNADEEHGHPHVAGDNSHDDLDFADVLEKKTVEATSVSPEYLQLATNIEVIPNILDSTKRVGVLTHEGVFGPFLFSEKIRSFFIELKPGMFLSEHPHPSESIVYTVSGKWVLCSEGKRQVMEAGSLFRFGSNMPTGWEAPFSEGAMLLIVKPKSEGENYETYMDGLFAMKAKLDNERINGNEFYYNELKSNHPAIEFARSVNPDFDEVLKINY